MLVYNFHPDSKEYTGSSEADEDPQTPGEFLIPANCTMVEPPAASEGHAVVWQGEAWGEAEDHRGDTWWTPDGQPVVINGLGNPADSGLLAEQPLPPQYAILLDGIVVGIVLTDGIYQSTLATGYAIVDDPGRQAVIGATYTAAAFTPPKPPE